jgi:DNA-binding Lrp family transcriptional regulator
MGVEAYVLLQVESDFVADAISRLRGLPAVTGAHAVGGPFDVIAEIRADDMSALSHAVLAEIRGLPGVAKTVTCVVKGGD